MYADLTYFDDKIVIFSYTYMPVILGIYVLIPLASISGS